MIRPFRFVSLVLLGLSCPAMVLPAAAEQQAVVKPAFLSLGDFTINLPEDSDQLSYVVISITLEVAPGAATELKGLEPRLKEAMMRRLLIMARAPRSAAGAHRSACRQGIAARLRYRIAAKQHPGCADHAAAVRLTGAGSIPIVIPAHSGNYPKLPSNMPQ